MRLEILYQLIVPLTFLAIWALTSLLNKEAQPLPARPARLPHPLGEPRLGGAGLWGEPASEAPYREVPERPIQRSAERAAPSRIAEPSSSPRLASGRLPGEEGITILDSESRAARAAMSGGSAAAGALVPRSGRAGPLRRAGRGRAGAGSAAAKPTEAGRPRALTSLVSQSMAEKKARPLAIAPLAAPLAPIAAPLSETVAVPVTQQPAARPRLPSYSAGELRSLLTSTTKLREMAVLSELLQPPLVLRPLRRHR
jgi:hypothetical protein